MNMPIYKVSLYDKTYNIQFNIYAVPLILVLLIINEILRHLSDHYLILSLPVMSGDQGEVLKNNASHFLLKICEGGGCS